MVKRYLNVSYKDRDLAKKLGARWDPSVRRWYCPAGSALETIFAWRKDAQTQAKATRDTASLTRPKSPKIAQNENFELPLAS